MHKVKSYRYYKVYVGFRLPMFCPILTKAASECFEQVSKFRKDDDGVYYCVMRTCEYDSPDDVLKQLWDFGAVHVEDMPESFGQALEFILDRIKKPTHEDASSDVLCVADHIVR